jgi:hypothetical protein
MPDEDFRPLSLGELLDRIFTLYRGHFRLFVGISVWPHALVLAWSVARIWLVTVPGRQARLLGPPASANLGNSIAAAVLFLFFETCFVFLFLNSATALAISEIYLGRRISASLALKRVFARLWRLAGCTVLCGIALLAAAVVFLLPAVVLAGRLIAALPAATIEDLSPGRAFVRSFRLTDGFLWRSLAIYLLYYVVRISAVLPLLYAQRIMTPSLIRFPATATIWPALLQFGFALEATLLGPVLAIGSTVFYFDQRVRKEALDLQMMMER